MTRYTVVLVRDEMSDAQAAEYLRPWGEEDAEKLARLRATYCGRVRRVEGVSDERSALAYAIAYATKRSTSPDDGCFGYRVEVEEHDAVVVHCHGSRTFGWALWSDGVITSGLFLSDAVRAANPQCLSPLACEIVGAIRGSDSGAPAMGWGALIDLLNAPPLLDVVVSPGASLPGGYQGSETRLVQTERGALWARSRGYCEGYIFEVGSTREEVEGA